jgi:hypothetical protein
MAEEPHQEEASFTSFWQRSADKISSKAVKFMPNVTKPGSGESCLILPRDVSFARHFLFLRCFLLIVRRELVYNHNTFNMSFFFKKLRGNIISTPKT